MKRLHQHAIRYPFRAVVLASLFTVVAGSGVGRLRLRTDGHALVPSNAPAVQLDDSVRVDFGIDDPLVVLVRTEAPHGIYNPRTLRTIRQLTDSLKRLPGIDSTRVVSLSTEFSDRHKPGTLGFWRFLDVIPESARDLNRLREDIDSLEVYSGTLVSFNGNGAAILVGVPRDVDRTAIVGRVAGLIRSTETGEDRVDIIGAPVAESQLGAHILEDLGVPERWIGQAGLSNRDAPRTLPRSVGDLGRLLRVRIGLLPLALLVMAVVFLVTFRSLAAVMLPLIEVGAALVTTFGLMGWLGVPIFITIAVLPVILTVIGVADEVHIFTRYAQQRREHPHEDPTRSVEVAMEEMSPPVVKTSVTTAIGFLSFAISPIMPVRAFGVFTAIGILYCMLWSLLIVPALLVLVQPRGFGRRKVDRPSVWIRLAKGTMRARLAILVGSALLILLMPLGIRRLFVQDSWIGGFARDSEFYEATAWFNENFFGAHILLILIEPEPVSVRGSLPEAKVEFHRLKMPLDLVPDPSRLVGCRVRISRTDSTVADARLRWNQWTSWILLAEPVGEDLVLVVPRRDGSPRFHLRLDPGDTVRYEINSRPFLWPALLGEIDAFQAFVASCGAYTVGGVMGPTTHLATTNFIVRKREAASRTVPDDPDRISWLWEQYARIRGTERLRQFLDAEYGRAIMTVHLKSANFVDTANLMKEIREYERTHMNASGIHLDFAGDVAVSQTLIGAIVKTQLRSLLISLAGILIVIAFLNRSFWWGVCGVLPSAVAVATIFAVMGWVRMPLGVSTSMFAGMTLGIGVDFGIHLIDRYRLSVRKGRSGAAALCDAFRFTVPAILIDGLVVALGFGTLLLSQVPANARLGGLTVVCLLSCLGATLFLIPALVRVFARSDGHIAVGKES